MFHKTVSSETRSMPVVAANDEGEIACHGLRTMKRASQSVEEYVD